MIHPPFYDTDTENSLLAPMFTNHDPKIEIKSFSWKLALFSPYKVLHVHWLEHLVAAPTIPKSFLKALLSMILLCRVSLSGIIIVNTRHNLIPHSRINNPLSRISFHLWGHRISTEVVMNHYELTSLKPARYLIPHPVYIIENFGATEYQPSLHIDGKYFIHLGRMDPKRLIIELIQNFGEFVHNSNLLLIGEVPDKEYLSRILMAANRYSNIFVIPEKVGSIELNSFIRNSSGVIGPLNNYHNSGVLFHALSHLKPILTRDNETSRELQSEIGGSLLNLDPDPCSPSAILRFIKISEHPTISKEFEIFLAQRQPIIFFQNHIELYKKISFRDKP